MTIEIGTRLHDVLSFLAFVGPLAWVMASAFRRPDGKP